MLYSDNFKSLRMKMLGVLQKIGFLSTKYILFRELLNDKGSSNEPYQEIIYQNKSPDAKIEYLKFHLYHNNELISSGDLSFSLTIGIIFKKPQDVTHFDSACPEELKPLYKKHMHTVNSEGNGVNFISIFSYDKEIIRNFFLAIQQFDELDVDTQAKLFDKLAIEIPKKTDSYTPTDTTMLQEMYQVGESQCSFR